jgi:uncharacterized repeat protein (TIGR03803 family)
LNVNVNSGTTYWVNVFNATVPSGDPVFWDENSGAGCYSNGCPSKAYESAIGTIASEAFDINGGNCGPCGCPPPPPPPPPSGCFQAGGGLQIVHDFSGQEGSGAGVTIDRAGNFYGTTGAGGANGEGMAYELSPKGQGWVLNQLFSFLGGSSGSGPSPVIVGPDAALYGTASSGIDNCYGDCGLVFSLRPAPTACLTALCSWMENVLFEPTGYKDPSASGSLVFDQEGNLYGTSFEGGAYASGAVFELTPSPGGWTEKIIYSFNGYDVAFPNSLLVGKDGNLYGTGQGGDTDGRVFQLVPSGVGWTVNILYSFWADGWEPCCLAQDSAGNLYGLALNPSGGYQDRYPIEVFMLSPSNGGWVLTLPYISPWYYYGGFATSGFATDAAGNVYVAIGHADPGGQRDSPADSGDYWWGTVMMRPPGGNFSQIWYSGDTEFTPAGPLAIDRNGNVYGTTWDCGKNGYGTVWKLTP